MQQGAVCKLSIGNNYKHTHTHISNDETWICVLAGSTNPIVKLLDHYTQVSDSGQSSRDFC